MLDKKVLIVMCTTTIVELGEVPEDVFLPRGHILKSLALASKLKALASELSSSRIFFVLGLSPALFSDWLKSKQPKKKKDS